ncbi:hypothetical protein [Dyadobacter sp. CY343]|uniref:hypothetical protein n=1 Tax=Dyadobacter sp. CY343 TaxID=2907299 RepID=UPI001F3D781D|nr:hypothetical protein [Dyadobacter sp. CY343]MCE7058686.1 hypothetical protein [Dyadobacter sp. CY343]
MIRTLIVPEKRNISIQLPDSFIGKQVEVIAFTVPDKTVKSATQDKTQTHYASLKSLSKDWLSDEEDKIWENL